MEKSGIWGIWGKGKRSRDTVEMSRRQLFDTKVPGKQFFFSFPSQSPFAVKLIEND